MAITVDRLVLLLAALAAPATAQETVWSSVSFVLYGERTPLQGSTSPELTPLGAQQMFDLGSIFRARYLSSANTTLPDIMASITSQALIEGIEEDSIDNDQVFTQATDDSYVAASALAFLQGLYPPQTSSFAAGNGGRDAAVLNNDTLVNFPLNGYQYPLVATLSYDDPASVWIGANIGCTEYQQSVFGYFGEDQTKTLYSETLGYYQSLWSGVFQDVFSQAMTNYYSAYNLYDYASYEYSHNPQMANALDSSDLAILRTYAYTQQVEINADLDVSGKKKGDMIRAISGRMLATYVVSLFKNTIDWDGRFGKLNLMFGSFEPFLAFFALSNLTSGVSASVFQGLPSPGATMVWELYTESDNTTTYPSMDDMYVRFFYRPNTDNDTALTQYGLFTNGSDVSGMPFQEFAAAMYAIGVPSVTKWCTMCSGVSVFCPAYEENSSGSGSRSGSSGSTSGSKSSMSPAVAGIIGAIIMLSAISLVGLVAIALGGLRVYRRAGSRPAVQTSDPRVGGVQDARSIGGFKGLEKKPGDADVVVAKTGMRHERVGSWELNGGKYNGKTVAANGDDNATPSGPLKSVGTVLQKSQVQSTIRNTDTDDDDMADLVGPVMTPKEHV
ncbi:histidine acid phosphatase [Grosmannia clavigera kw1407]|uniref:Histidine acid phosphatase n=1 Tax=Grosmannia clavigera (strain kw1407 / UAMH 11150) TaxID=655863 RepID=F0X7D0_GROCL|nr:histidine acid phosphatase [Grosmannia clavigera kw1407]EFX06508.1 histidine acid phosphatase [Grosmannia clavigera kw1407]